MRTKVGLWIDHRKALIVAVMDKGEEMRLTDRQIATKVRRYFQENMERLKEGRKMYVGQKRCSQ